MQPSCAPHTMHEPAGVSSSSGSANDTPKHQVIALCPDHNTHRPQWVKFSFPDLFGSLKWRRMTLAQKGAYIVLLGEQAINGPLPSDPEDLACIVACSSSNVTEGHFTEAWKSPLTECFEERDGRLVNPRMAEELSDYSSIAQSLSDKRSAAGKAGAAKREANRKQNQASAKQVPSKPKQSQARVEEIRVEERIEEGKKVAPAPDALASALTGLEHKPAWIIDLLTEYRDHRVELKGKKQGALTSKGWRAKAAQFDKLGEASARACVELSVSNGWLGLFPEKVQHASAQTPSRGSYYKGAPLKATELNRIGSEIRMRYAKKTNDFMLADDVALDLARADNDPQVWDLDWRCGRRNDPPPLNTKPLEISHEPPF